MKIHNLPNFKFLMLPSTAGWKEAPVQTLTFSYLVGAVFSTFRALFPSTISSYMA